MALPVPAASAMASGSAASPPVADPQGRVDLRVPPITTPAEPGQLGPLCGDRAVQARACGKGLIPAPRGSPTQETTQGARPAWLAREARGPVVVDGLGTGVRSSTGCQEAIAERPPAGPDGVGPTDSDGIDD